MSVVLQRVEFEATIDELVDANLRLANRTTHYRRKKLRTSLMTGMVPVIGTLVMGRALAQTLPPAVVFGAFIGFAMWRVYDRLINHQLHKAITDALGGVQTIHGEIELRPDEVWIRQQGHQMTFPWGQAAGVEEAGNAIELRFNPGLVVVRNRFFHSPDARDAFLAAARRLAASTID